MLLKDYVTALRTDLSGIYPQEEANALVDIVCQECFGVQSYTRIIEPGYEIKDKLLIKADSVTRRLLQNEPIQYILGHAEFCGRRFTVSPSVLIPRPETEILCKDAYQSAMRVFRNRSAYGKGASAVKILDLCTGSGCIAWTLALDVPGASVTAIDISEEALSVARSQKFDIGKGRSPRFVKADIFDDEQMQEALGDGPAFDIIVSNPPYVFERERGQMRPNVLNYEPAIALFVPDDDTMLFNRKIAEIAKKYLYTDANACVEINEAAGPESAALFRENGFKSVETLKDIFGKNRIVKFQK